MPKLALFDRAARFPQLLLGSYTLGDLARGQWRAVAVAGAGWGWGRGRKLLGRQDRAGWTKAAYDGRGTG